MNPSDPTPDPTDLGAALAMSFRPDWAKENQSTADFEKLARKHGEDQSDRPRDDRGASRDRRPRRDGLDRDRRPSRNDRGPKRDGRSGDRGPVGNRKDSRRDGPRPEREAPPMPGWKLRFIPDASGLDGLAKEIKSSGKTVSLFDLAWLVLARPERYSVEFTKPADASGKWVQCLADQSMWPDETSAIQHVLESCLENYYRVEDVEVDPPKGNFQCVAVCGMSDTVLGPPNFHSYQTALVRLHAAKFARVPFDLFKSRVRMVRDEAQVEAWRESMSKVQRFVPLDGVEDSQAITDREALRRHFRETHGKDALMEFGESAVISGVAAAVLSCAEVRNAVRRIWEDLKRFPLPLAHELGRGLGSRGIAVFKLSDNVTYASVSRPKYLDRAASPISDEIQGMLQVLEMALDLPRAEQWKQLLACRTQPEDPAAKEAAVAGDLLWLVREGHILDMAQGNLRLAPKPKTGKPSDGKSE